MTTQSLSLIHRLQMPAAAPDDHTPRHPALLALHGRGSDEADLLGLAPYLDDRLLWLSARAPLTLEGGFEWYRPPMSGAPTAEHFADSLAALESFVAEIAEAYPIDAQRLYVFGFSQGTFMAYALALTQPQRVAGVIAHSGALPLQTISAARSVNPAALRGKPVLVLHGTQDRTIPLARAHEAREYLTEAGAGLEYHEYPIAHHVSEATLSAMDTWLQLQLDQPPIRTPSDDPRAYPS
jgi:phospholipase/carboxylesterase